MQEFNLILVDDDKEMIEDYLSYFDNMLYFRDLKTFREGVSDTSFWEKLNKSFPLILVLDIMLAEELDHRLKEAPRWNNSEKDPDELHEKQKKKIRRKAGVVAPISEKHEIERKKYIDNELGLRIAKNIRQGFFENINKDIPIVFITARQNELTMSSIAQIKSSTILHKPIWFDQLENKIISLITNE